MMAEIARAPNVRQAAIDNAPGLTETAVEFVKRQSAFVHKVTNQKTVSFPSSQSASGWHQNLFMKLNCNLCQLNFSYLNSMESTEFIEYYV